MLGHAAYVIGLGKRALTEPRVFNHVFMFGPEDTGVAAMDCTDAMNTSADDMKNSFNI